MKLIVRARSAVRRVVAQVRCFRSIFPVVRRHSSRVDGRSQQEEEQICAQSGLFDREWYLERNPDVASSGMNPLTHYIRFGAIQAQCYSARASGMGRSPTVSAIVPCYNGAQWLAEALESIEAQSLPVHEIIVVDD